MKAIRLLGFAALAVLAACSKPVTSEKAPEAAAPAQPPFVTVNGKAFSSDLFEDYAQTMTNGKATSELSPEDREQIREELVRMDLVAEKAVKDGLDKDPKVASRLEIARLNILQQAAAQKYLKERAPTDAELHAEFDAQVAATPLVEYHARHILVSSEETAQKIIEQLKNGGDFATLAKRFSADTSTAQKGGDLGWFHPDAMRNKNFSDAVGLLKKNEITSTPVQTQYGWHVVQLLETRDRPPPSFEGVEDQLRRIVLSRKFRAYQDDLLRTAKVDPPLANMPAPVAPATPAAPAAPTPAPAAQTPPKTN